MEYIALHGKPLIKNGWTFTIESIRHDKLDNYVITATSGESFKVCQEDLDKLLNEVLNTEDKVSLVKRPEVMEMAQHAFKNFGAINDVMLDTIQRVQKDPSYIPQANALNATISTMLDAAKVQVDIIKIMKG